MSLFQLRRGVIRSLKQTAACRYRLNHNPSRVEPDPWPLPLSPEHLESTTTNEGLHPIEPLPRHNEREQQLRARLVYQSRKRGTLEADLLMSTFAKEFLSTMTLPELQEYDQLLNEPDWDIFYWAVEKRQPPERWAKTELLEKLKIHARNEGKVVRQMPELQAH